MPHRNRTSVLCGSFVAQQEHLYRTGLLASAVRIATNSFTNDRSTDSGLFGALFQGGFFRALFISDDTLWEDPVSLSRGDDEEFPAGRTLAEGNGARLLEWLRVHQFV